MDRLNTTLLFLLIILLCSPICHSWGWFSSSSTSAGNTDSSFPKPHKSNPEFSMEVFNNQKAIRIVEDAKRPAFPTCNDKSTMMSCLKKLNDHEHKIYLEFMLETNTICQQLQSYAFMNEIERLVNELRMAAQDTEDKLDTLENKSDVLIQSSNMVYESLGSIDIRVQNVAQKTDTIETNMNGLSKKTEEIYQEATIISDSQLVLRDCQEKMRETLKDGMDMLSDAYTNLGEGIDKLMSETYQIVEDISELGKIHFLPK